MRYNAQVNEFNLISTKVGQIDPLYPYSYQRWVNLTHLGRLRYYTLLDVYFIYLL
jgi:hypothetical protein